MAKDQTVTNCRPNLTEKQRLNQICSILSIGVIRRIQAEKALTASTNDTIDKVS